MTKKGKTKKYKYGLSGERSEKQKDGQRKGGFVGGNKSSRKGTGNTTGLPCSVGRCARLPAVLQTTATVTSLACLHYV